jgi:hypothetical protein
MSTSSLHTEPTGSTPTFPLQGCYLVHFDQPYKSGRHPGAQHYVGDSDDIDRRIEMHRKGHGSPLLPALAVGIDFRVVRTWPGTDRHFERKLHIRHGSRLCPSRNAFRSDVADAYRALSCLRKSVFWPKTPCAWGQATV